MAYLNTTTAPTFSLRIRSIVDTWKDRAARKRVYRQTLNELIVLSDRELADLGLHRAHLRRIAREAAEM